MSENVADQLRGSLEDIGDKLGKLSGDPGSSGDQSSSGSDDSDQESVKQVVYVEESGSIENIEMSILERPSVDIECILDEESRPIAGDPGRPSGSAVLAGDPGRPSGSAVLAGDLGRPSGSTLVVGDLRRSSPNASESNAITMPAPKQPDPLSFKQRKTFSTRKNEAAGIRAKFPTKVPVIVERYHKEKTLAQLDKTKFLVPQELTMSQFSTIIRNRMVLSSTQSLYLVIGNRTITTQSMTLSEIYKDEKDEDGFLYMTYASQEMFG